jgi:hypothetical protein
LLISNFGSHTVIIYKHESLKVVSFSVHFMPLSKIYETM